MTNTLHLLQKIPTPQGYSTWEANFDKVTCHVGNCGPEISYKWSTGDISAYDVAGNAVDIPPELDDHIFFLKTGWLIIATVYLGKTSVDLLVDGNRVPNCSYYTTVGWLHTDISGTLHHVVGTPTHWRPTPINRVRSIHENDNRQSIQFGLRDSE